jgi:tRNA-modifying protein YgfZ
MSQVEKIALLADRGVVSVTGTDARAFLDNMITNDMDTLTAGASAIFAGLLTPQGKILFEFFVVPAHDGYLLDTQRDKVSDLANRLAMYKLRSKVAVQDVSGGWDVWTAWGQVPLEHKPWIDPPKTYDARFDLTIIGFRDPRFANDELGMRWFIPLNGRDEVLRQAAAQADVVNLDAYDARRVALGIAEGGRDYPLGDTFPHEANWDRMHGVSFTKGCYVGQEVVARMQNKAVVRKRVVRISGERLTMGADILHGAGVIGRIGTVAGEQALAMLRLDRAVEAADKNEPLLAHGAAIAVDETALADYRRAIADRPVIDL